MNIHLTCAKKLAKSFLFEQGYRITSFDKIEWLKKIKNNIAYKTDYSDCEEVYFSESKQPLKSRWGEQKRSVQNCDCKKNEIAKHCWEADHNFSWSQKKVLDTESRLIPRKIKETIHSLKNPNHINKISYILPEIWLPKLRQFLVNYLFHTRRF